MSKLYANSSLSSLSTEQVQRTEPSTSENPNSSNSSSSSTVHIQHRRHSSLSGRTSLPKSLTKSASITDINQKLYQDNRTQYDPVALSDRITGLSYDNSRTRDIDEVDGDETRRRKVNANTKDGFLESVKSSTLTYDEPDHLQHRFTRTAQTTVFNARHSHEHLTDNSISDVGGCTSGMSSTLSSTCPSTVSSPLSTPTRLSPQHHYQHHRQQQEQQIKCCTKSIVSPVKNSNSSTSSIDNHLKLHNNISFSQQSQHLPELNDHHDRDHQQQHYHHHHKTTFGCLPTTTAAAAAAAATATTTIIKSGSKNIKKFDPRLGPSPYRQLLPIALCILSFATVFSILIVYMDTTEIRHQQFRLNMSRDYELYGVAQDDPQLIAFLREIHMRKYPNYFFKTSAANAENGLPGGGGGGSGVSSNADLTAHLNFSSYPNDLTPKMAYYVTNVLQGKTDGAVIQSLTGSLGHLMTAPWLSETFNWAGVIVEPEPRRYFTLRKQNALRPRLQVVHACVSPQPYPKEVTIHNEESEVRINSLLDEETSWFNSRVKCFPLYTIMLASNRLEYDLLSLGVHGHELEILQTLPFEKIKIEIISIHLMENQEDVSNYVQMLTSFLEGKSYKLQKKFGRNYFYQRLATPTNTKTMPTRTRKKDILLLKTP